MKRAVLIVLVLGLASRAFGWSAKEHIVMTRIAAERLLQDAQTPPAMKAWLKEAAPGLPGMAGEKQYLLTARVGIWPRGVEGVAYWSVVPDLVASADREKPVEPYGVPERSLHFVDVELLNADPAKRTYAADLSNRPALEQIPRDIRDARWVKAGMLPFRVQECHERMATCIRDGRLIDKPGQFPRDGHAARWAGYLAHYAADSTQPHHATIDYRSQHYLPTTAPAGRRPDPHADFEFRLVDDPDADYPELRAEFWSLFAKHLDEPAKDLDEADPWAATMRTLLDGYAALPLVGQAARAAYLDQKGAAKPFEAESFYHARGEFAGQRMTLLELKARRMALAVHRIERLWRGAWDAAQQPASQPSR